MGQIQRSQKFEIVWFSQIELPIETPKKGRQQQQDNICTIELPQ